MKYFQEFKQILANYQVSDRAKQALSGLKLVLLLAPSAAGRNTTIQHLVKTGRYYFIVSDTTRPPRINDGTLEQNGREYWFRSEEEFLADLKRGEYLEAEIIHQQQVSGISIRELEKAQKARKVAVKDIDIEGIRNVKRAKPNAFTILLLPPSFEEWQMRLISRGKMSQQEQLRRMQTAQQIFNEAMEQNDYQFVVADNVERSAMAIDAIVQGQHNPEQDRGYEVLRRLQDELSEKLSENPFG